MIAERLKQIWDKLRVVLGAIGLLLLSNLPVILLDSSRGLIPPQFKNGFLLLIAVLAGLIIWYCWRRAEKMDLKIWDPEILSWRGLGMVLAGYIAMVVCDSLALHLMNLQGIETSANQALESLCDISFKLSSYFETSQYSCSEIVQIEKELSILKTIKKKSANLSPLICCSLIELKRVVDLDFMSFFLKQTL